MTVRNEMAQHAGSPVDSTQSEDFDAILWPYRSLGPRGFLMLMTVLCGISFTAGMVFVLMGAWPVFGFFGLDVLLVYFAFKLNYRAAGMHEEVHIDGEELTVKRVSPGGEMQEWSFNPYWVRVDFQEYPDGTNRLALVSHGRRVSIAAFLSPDERAEFAHALTGALKARRG